MNRFGINTIAFKDELTRGAQQIEYISKIKLFNVEVLEIRREFLNEKYLLTELTELKMEAEKQNVTLFYSVNDELFQIEGLNPQIKDYVKEALLLNAERIKFNFGYYQTELSIEEINVLTELTANSPKINIENNQTVEHCNLVNMEKFLIECKTNQIPINFCFDLANWLWTGTEVQHAIDKLKDYTDYVHLKNYKNEGIELVVTSLAGGKLSWEKYLNQFHSNIDLTLEYNGSNKMIEEDLRLLRLNEK